MTDIRRYDVDSEPKIEFSFMNLLSTVGIFSLMLSLFNAGKTFFRAFEELNSVILLYLCYKIVSSIVLMIILNKHTNNFFKQIFSQKIGRKNALNIFMLFLLFVIFVFLKELLRKYIKKFIKDAIN